MENVPALPREPSSVPLPPFVPYMAYGQWTFVNQFRAQLEGLRDKDPYDPAVERLVAQVLGDLRDAPAPQKLARLHRWVLEEIDPAGGWGGYAPVMVQARRGDRTRVLRYMLQMAGLPTDIVIVRGLGTPDPRTLANDDVYETAVLRVRAPGAQPLFAFAEIRGTTWDVLPVQVRGQEGVVLAVPADGDALERVTLPDAGPQMDRHVAHLEVQLERTGDARVRVRETFHGTTAAMWRQQLKEVPPAELPRLMAEQYVPRLLVGAEVESVQVGGVESWDAPITFDYAARVRGYARVRGGALMLPPLHPSNLTRSHAPLPARTTTQLVGGHVREVTTVVRGVSAETPIPQAVQWTERGIQYARTSRREGNDLIVERHVHVPWGTVTAADYPAFAVLIRRLAAVESAEIEVR
jgi:hypothetical protein